jgi:hypothetical protein
LDLFFSPVDGFFGFLFLYQLCGNRSMMLDDQVSRLLIGCFGLNHGILVLLLGNSVLFRGLLGPQLSVSNTLRSLDLLLGRQKDELFLLGLC